MHAKRIGEHPARARMLAKHIDRGNQLFEPLFGGPAEFAAKFRLGARTVVGALVKASRRNSVLSPQMPALQLPSAAAIVR